MKYLYTAGFVLILACMIKIIYSANRLYDQQEALEETRVEGDKDYLAKAVRNLLSNAAAYNVPEGRILITLKEKSCAIENTGFPLSEEQLKRSFELFYSGNKSQDGKHMGMGLYLAEKIFSRHGLSIALENTKIRVKSTVSAASR
ncbi:MAG: sensor histidine kinase [Lachnospiraceae bacterium]|nr:sensor histidine kinase [Lachnospiraceae bacterium]